MASERGFFRNPGPVILGLEKKAPWSRLDSGQFRGLVVGLAVLMAVLAGVTWGRVRVLANGYEIMELRTRRDALLAENQRLKRRLSDLSSLDYVESTARERLGMVDINPNQVIVLRPESPARRIADSIESFFGAEPSGRTNP